MRIRVLSHPHAVRRSDLERRWLVAAVLSLLFFPNVGTVHAGDLCDRKGMLSYRKSFVAVFDTVLIAPSPRDAVQDLYVDTSYPMISGQMYAGPTDGLSSDGIRYANEYIGYNGAGTFSQTGGANTIIGSLSLGYNLGSSGTYTLAGTGTMSASVETIGSSGTGTFNQSGGTNTVGTLYLVSPGSSSTYSLSGGALSAATEQIGFLGVDTFEQSGGTNSVSSTLTLGDSGTDFFPTGGGGSFFGTGTYNLSGTGSLSASTETVGNTSIGVFNQTGGTNTVSSTLALGTGMAFYYSPGTYNLSDTGTLSASSEQVGGISTGTFNQSGGTNTVTGKLQIGSSAANDAYNLSGDGALSASSEYVGNGGPGAFRQTSGTNTVSGTLYVGYGSPGTYNLGGTGALSAGVEEIGAGGTGTFNQAGGTNTVSGLELAAGSGTSTYNLSGGVLAASTEFLAAGGTGIFNHTGGNNTVSGAFYLLSPTGASGTYNLSGSGILSAPSEYIGGAASIFNQTGGTNTITNAVNGALLFGGFLGGGTGTYNLNGGTLQTRAVALNTSGMGGFMMTPPVGIFNFNGGTLQAAATNPVFMTGLTAANVQAGGAIIDSNGYAVTVGQPLLGGVSSGPDGGLTKQGAGTLTLTGASTFNGPTVLSAGTLALNAGSNPALGSTGAVTVNGGAILRLGADNQINPAATLSLNANSGPAAGATVAFSTGGHSQTLGALTLVSTSVIDLVGGTSVLRLGNSAGSWTGTLAIWDWTGIAITGGGANELFFGTDTSGLTEAQLLAIRFYSDSGTTLLGPAGYALSDDGEVVPDGVLPGTGVVGVPEPSTWLVGAALLGVAFLRRHRHADRAIWPRNQPDHLSNSHT